MAASLVSASRCSALAALAKSSSAIARCRSDSSAEVGGGPAGAAAGFLLPDGMCAPLSVSDADRSPGTMLDAQGHAGPHWPRTDRAPATAQTAPGHGRTPTSEVPT